VKPIKILNESLTFGASSLPPIYVFYGRNSREPLKLATSISARVTTKRKRYVIGSNENFTREFLRVTQDPD